jgi:hypothetical protein
MRFATVSWTTLKALLASKQLSVQYVDDGNAYEVFAIEQNISWEAGVQKDGLTDCIDFETNYLPTANQPLEIKAAAGRPIRNAPSPQPNGTIQRWSGKVLPLNTNGLTTVYNLFFNQPVYLTGGDFFGDNTDGNDTLSMYVTVPSEGLTVITSVDAVPVPTSVDSPRAMYAPEAMLFPLGVNLTIVYVSCGLSNTGDWGQYNLHITVNYFETDPRVSGIQSLLYAQKVS